MQPPCASMIPRADHYRLPTDRHRVAKLVTCRRVRGDELLLLGPNSPAAHKDIGRALIAARCAISITSANRYRLPADRHRDAKHISCRRVRGKKLLLLAPYPSAARKNIDCALSSARCAIMLRRGDH